MANDDHQKIIEAVLDIVRRQLKESGMLDFAVTLDEEGREGRIAIDPEFFRSDATKDRLKRDTRLIWQCPARTTATSFRRSVGRSIDIGASVTPPQPCHPALRRPSSMCSWSSGRNQGGRLVV
jgi:hypothetical protein